MKLLRILLPLSLLIMVLAVMSNSFDIDLGWHLTFGETFWNTGKIPFLNTNTWTYAGKLWVNHEWFGDIVIWKIYQNLGYFSLLMIMSGALMAAFLGVHRAFKQNLTLPAIIVSLACVWCVEQTIIMRLAMLTPLFLILLIAVLERAASIKTIFIIPLLLYVWSVLHGSWVLGFIVIGIFAAGEIVQYYFGDRLPFIRMKPKERRSLRNIILGAAIAAPLPLINPYGIGLYQEVAKYFTESFYKPYIIEWLPVYAAPIYWRSLVFIAVSLVAFVFAIKKQKLTMPQILLFCALLVAGANSKRNMILFVLVAVPLFAGLGEAILTKITKRLSLSDSRFYTKIAVTGGCIALLLATTANVLAVRYSPNVWNDAELLTNNRIPDAAIRFLAQKDAAPFVFNYFNWGGPLGWMIPEAKIFMDGCGASTWRRSTESTLLGEYISILNEPDGLSKLMNSPAEYVLLPPTTLNSTLYLDLDRSPDWKRIYDDGTAIIWERVR